MSGMTLRSSATMSPCLTPSFMTIKNSVIAGNSAQYQWYATVVDVVSQTAGIARTCPNNAHVARKVDRHKSRRKQHLGSRLRARHALIHRLVGQHIEVFAAQTCSLCHLKLFHVAAQRGLRNLVAFFLKSLEHLVLTTKLLARDKHTQSL